MSGDESGVVDVGPCKWKVKNSNRNSSSSYYSAFVLSLREPHAEGKLKKKVLF